MAHIRRRTRIPLAAAQALAVIAISGGLLWGYQKLTAPEPHDVVFGGDVMLGRDVERWMDEGADPLRDVAPLLHSASEVVVNLEAPLTTATHAVDKAIVLKAPLDSAEYLKANGVSVVTLANNHTFDYGVQGYLDTIEALGDAGIGSTGAGESLEEATRPVLFSMDGVDVALLAFSKWNTDTVPEATRDTFGQAYLGDETFGQSISSAKARADLVVVALHFGREYELVPDDRQREAVTQAIAAGADLVIGHHPHVTQPVEVIDGVPVFYSLGNFVFDQETPPRERSFLVGWDISPDSFSFRLYPYRVVGGEVEFMDSSSGVAFLHEVLSRGEPQGIEIASDGTARFSVDR